MSLRLTDRDGPVKPAHDGRVGAQPISRHRRTWFADPAAKAATASAAGARPCGCRVKPGKRRSRFRASCPGL